MKGRLLLIAHGRSGDKGDTVNIGVIARRSEWYHFLCQQITAERVAEHLAEMADGPVHRYQLDNLDAINFVVECALGGGGAMTLRLDAQGKAYASALFRMVLEYPQQLADEIRIHWGADLPADCVIDNAAIAEKDGGAAP